MAYYPDASPEFLPPDGSREADALEAERAVLSPAIISIFGLRGVYDVASYYDDSNASQAYRINMPALEVQPGPKGSLIVPLSRTAQRAIHERSRSIVSIPNAGHEQFEHRELLRFQQWLDAMAAGKGEAEIGPRRTVGRISGRMRDYLGATNQASTMYSALLHGYVPDVSVPDIDRPDLTVNRNLHLYLAALGFEATEAARLTGKKDSEVKALRLQAAKKLGATAMTQAITHAFMVGLYMPLPTL